ncbi:MAG: hypothetical protein ABIH40_03665 [Candidatus Omnitrophota bacterium]
MTFISFLLLGVTLSGCVTTSIKTASDVFLYSSIDTDSYKKTTWIQSPSLDGWIYSVWLRAQVENKKVISYQIYVLDRDDDWRFFHSAYDADGKKLDFRTVDSLVESTGLYTGYTREDYVIVLKREYLNNSVGKEINFKAVGKRGERVIVVPSFYIEGFLKKVDEYIAK